MPADPPTANPSPALELLLDATGVDEALSQMAGEITARHGTEADLLLVGIPTRGVEVARRLITKIHERTGRAPELGVVDVSMHRDDLATRDRLTAVETTQLPVDLEGRTLILVDDVLFTGRSVRAALDALWSYGRPGRIELAVLVDRGHRQLPIQPDYTGKKTSTEFREKIRVRFSRLDGVPDSVHLVKP
jgi:pyrimidine operon attenuation protein/uracil phosphoribosyltransferase